MMTTLIEENGNGLLVQRKNSRALVLCPSSIFAVPIPHSAWVHASVGGPRPHHHIYRTPVIVVSHGEDKLAFEMQMDRVMPSRPSGQGSIRVAVHRRRRGIPPGSPPPPDQSDHRSKKRNLPSGKSGPFVVQKFLGPCFPASGHATVGCVVCLLDLILVGLLFVTFLLNTRLPLRYPGTAPGPDSPCLSAPPPPPNHKHPPPPPSIPSPPQRQWT